MTVENIYQIIVKQKPFIIYISGKTSTGKSTFSRKLHHELGYQSIELEAVLLKIIEEQAFDEQSTFRKVLYESGDFAEKSLFLEATDRIISDALDQKHPVVIEGAVANAETLQRILSPASNLLFLYFHPTDINVYIRNLTKRFMESSEKSYGGLALKFWQFIDTEEFDTFCRTRELTEPLTESIAQYARDSQKESLKRLEEFQHKFENVIVVEIQ